MRVLALTVLAVSPPVAAEVLTCAYVSAAGGKARVRVERKAEEVVLVSVKAVTAELTLRKRGASGDALKVVSWEATPPATEIAFAAPGEPPGRVSFEEQEGSFLIQVRGAPPAIRQALRLEGGWFALVLRPGEPDCRMATVGMAMLKPNGELHMQWRSWDRGMLAEFFEIVKPGDPRHAAYLRHVGGLNPGETKPIPAFEPPDATSR